MTTSQTSEKKAAASRANGAKSRGPITPERYNAENGFRWMGKRAVVEMGGPASAKQRLVISGYGPAVAVAKGGHAQLLEADKAFTWTMDCRRIWWVHTPCRWW